MLFELIGNIGVLTHVGFSRDLQESSRLKVGYELRFGCYLAAFTSQFEGKAPVKGSWDAGKVRYFSACSESSVEL